MFHFVETINIFKLLLIENENFYLFLNFIEDNNILLFALSISLLSNIYYFLKDFKIINILLDIFANLPFGTAGIVDANYTITANSITVTKTGRYKITCRVSVEMTDGNNRSESEYQLTNNNVVIPGTYAAASHRNRNINITTITVIKVVDLYAGETIRVEGRKALGSGSLQTHALSDQSWRRRARRADSVRRGTEEVEAQAPRGQALRVHAPR